MATRYVVKGEHTLGYILTDDFCPPNYSLADFEAYRVQPPKGWNP